MNEKYRDVRKRRNVTIYDLARLFGVTPQAISMYERGLFVSKRLEKKYTEWIGGGQNE